MEAGVVLTDLHESPRTLDPVNTGGSTSCVSVGRVPQISDGCGECEGVSCQCFGGLCKWHGYSSLVFGL